MKPQRERPPALSAQTAARLEELAALAGELAGRCRSRELIAGDVQRLQARREACLAQKAELRSGAALQRAQLALAGLRLERELLCYEQSCLAAAAEAPAKANPALERGLRRRCDETGRIRRRITQLESALLLARERERRQGSPPAQSAQLQTELDLAQALLLPALAAQRALQAECSRLSGVQRCASELRQAQGQRLRRRMHENEAEIARMRRCCDSLRKTAAERLAALEQEMDALERAHAALLAEQERAALLWQLHRRMEALTASRQTRERTSTAGTASLPQIKNKEEAP